MQNRFRRAGLVSQTARESFRYWGIEEVTLQRGRPLLSRESELAERRQGSQGVRRRDEGAQALYADPPMSHRVPPTAWPPHRRNPRE